TYLEQQNAVRGVTNGGNGSREGKGQNGNAGGTGSLVPVNNGNVVLPFLLCPSRGIRGNGLTDYNYVQQSTAVLYGAPVGVSLARISNANGASHTSMVAHLACNPQDYASGPTSWYNCIQPTSCRSMPDDEVPIGLFDQAFSSPHPGLNLVLFADGSVQSLDHQWLTGNQSIWNWQNTTVISFP